MTSESITKYFFELDLKTENNIFRHRTKKEEKQQQNSINILFFGKLNHRDSTYYQIYKTNDIFRHRNLKESNSKTFGK